MEFVSTKNPVIRGSQDVSERGPVEPTISRAKDFNSVQLLTILSTCGLFNVSLENKMAIAAKIAANIK